MTLGVAGPQNLKRNVEERKVEADAFAERLAGIVASMRVGEVFQQAFRNRWLDQNAEFDIPRPRPPEQRRDDPITEIVNSVLGRILRQLRVN